MQFTESKPKYIRVKKDKTFDQKHATIEKLVKNQMFTVLPTSNNNLGHTSLISFAVSDDLRHLVFATPIISKKYNFIENNLKVSLLIDNRCNNKNINDIAAVTLTGRAFSLEDKKEIEKWRLVLISKHKNLKDFITAKSSKIILVNIEKYNYVSSFQKVFEYKIIK